MSWIPCMSPVDTAVWFPALALLQFELPSMMSDMEASQPARHHQTAMVAQTFADLCRLQGTIAHGAGHLLSSEICQHRTVLMLMFCLTIPLTKHYPSAGHHCIHEELKKLQSGPVTHSERPHHCDTTVCTAAPLFPAQPARYFYQYSQFKSPITWHRDWGGEKRTDKETSTPLFFCMSKCFSGIADPGCSCLVCYRDSCGTIVSALY